MDIKAGGVKGKVDGETQFLIGAGFIFQATGELDILGELNFATGPTRIWTTTSS